MSDTTVLYEYDGYGKLTQTRDIYNGSILFTADTSYIGSQLRSTIFGLDYMPNVSGGNTV